MKRDNSKAGGKNTTIHGLQFEKDSEIRSKLKCIEPNHLFDSIVCEVKDKPIICTSKYNLAKILSKDYKKDVKKLLPDEAFIDVKNKKLFIVEKKFQKCNGSVDEKIRTCLFLLEILWRIVSNIYY